MCQANPSTCWCNRRPGHGFVLLEMYHRLGHPCCCWGCPADVHLTTGALRPWCTYTAAGLPLVQPPLRGLLFSRPLLSHSTSTHAAGRRSEVLVRIPGCPRAGAHASCSRPCQPQGCVRPCVASVLAGGLRHPHQLRHALHPHQGALNCAHDRVVTSQCVPWTIQGAWG